MGITAKNRASLRLTGTTAMPPAQVLQTLTEAVANVKGVSTAGQIAFSSLWTIGAHVEIVGRTDSELRLALNSGKNLVELCTFRARVTADGSGRTNITVGGLETYKTTQQTYMGFIPAGPKMITGMPPYKNFLNGVSSLISERDRTAQVSIAQAA
ncbi:hypothetical protein [Acidipropionibacterium acidipropionici]|uniref:hypothetical protein n=1 Tax=Acidipropionibacterium acidipropionici TaxID=1748 RepID=UPI00110B2D61|nr:hypothetical protein [Acidipropionibacterium acidipropionici]QCV96493.1 hypothetical protein FEZ30_15660 [Acidipropionibacterium acidipropionici]